MKPAKQPPHRRISHQAAHNSHEQTAGKQRRTQFRNQRQRPSRPVVVTVESNDRDEVFVLDRRGNEKRSDFVVEPVNRNDRQGIRHVDRQHRRNFVEPEERPRQKCDDQDDDHLNADRRCHPNEHSNRRPERHRVWRIVQHQNRTQQRSRRPSWFRNVVDAGRHVGLKLKECCRRRFTSSLSPLSIVDIVIVEDCECRFSLENSE